MKKFVSVILCIVMVSMSFSCFAYEDSAKDLKIDLADKSPFGEFEGWGTSLCWWGHFLGKSLEDDEIDSVVKALYDEDEGLGLNIARFNIGGGDDPEHNHQREYDGRDMPGFSDKDGNWNFDADKGQIEVLRKCIKYGADTLEAFSNSPPYFMTKSGCSSGGDDPNEDNLAVEKYPEFAAYLADVIKYLKDEYDIDFDTLEPMNEPGTNYWQYGSWQEGCHFDAKNHSALITACRKALDERGLESVGVAASDETSISKAAENLSVYTEEALSILSQVNTHSYHVGSYSSLREAALKAGKKIHMTEFDGDSSIGENAGNMGPALWLSQKITDDLRGLEASAWVLWQAVAMAYPNSHRDAGYWNIAQYDPETKTFEPFKKYYAYKQYTSFIRPGDTLVKTDSDNVLSAVNESEGKLVYVITNSKAKDEAYNIVTENIGMKLETVESFITDNTRDCEKYNQTDLNHFIVPKNSIVTIVLKGQLGGKSISLREKNGSVCAFEGEELEFVVSDEKGNEVEASLSLSENAPAQTDGNKVKISGEGIFEVKAQYGALSDSVLIYAVTDSSKVRIVGKGSGKALNGREKKIFIDDTSKKGSQIWQIEKIGDCYAFKNDRTGKYLSAESSLTTGEMSDYALWKLEKDNGYYSLINKKTNQSADVYSHGVSTGAIVGMYEYNGGANQLWYFDPTAPQTELETDYVISKTVLKGTPFGTDSWTGNPDVSFDKAWDGNYDTFFDAADGSGGYTGIDLGEEHLPFNKIEATVRVGFESRMIGATIWGSNDENGEYSLIYTIKEEDISGETANIDLGKFADFRFVKYVSSENGYCNVSEIALVYDVCNIEASIENGELKISLNENVETGGEKAVIGYYSGTSLTKSVICDFEDSKSAFAEALESDSDVSVTVLGKENSLLCRLFIKKY
jgi:O-glycosyl hydrolase